MRIKNRKQGFALPAVLFSLVIVEIIAIAAITSSDDETRSDKAFRESGLAMYAAEAGVRNTLGAWPTTAVRALAAGDSVVVGTGWTAMANSASYRVVIYRVDNNGLQSYAVFSTGRRPSAVGGRATVTAVVTGVPLWQWGVFTAGNLSMSGGGGNIDSYDSGLGAYGGVNVDLTAGSVEAGGNVALSGGATIHGNATATGTIAAGVTGTSTPGAGAFPAPANLACPAGGYTAAIANGGNTHVAYNAATGVLNVSSGNLTLPYPAGGAYYFSSLTLSGGSTLTMNTGGQHVDIYVDNLVNISGGGLVNTGSIPSQVNLSACGSPASPATWTLSGSSGAYFTVYAPNHAVTISGGGQISGALIGASLNNSGGSAIHFDKSLTNAAGNTLTLVKGSWAQLSVF